MSSKASLRWRVGSLGLVVGLALVTICLLLWSSEAGAVFPPVEAPGYPRQLPSVPGIITGAVFYDGTVTGTHLVWVGAFTSTVGGPPAFSTIRSGPGFYSLTVEAGTYHIFGGMDADDSGGPPDPTIDPFGSYSQNPLTVTAGAVITGVDIILVDPVSPPTGTGSISGWISYTGRITGTHNIIVFAGQAEEPGPPAYFTVISGAGPYTITNVPDDTYTVAAFMDLEGDMGPPEPGEPFGWYDPDGDSQPDPVIVSEGHAVTGITFALRDPFYYVYLPLILRTDTR